MLFACTHLCSLLTAYAELKSGPLPAPAANDDPLKLTCSTLGIKYRILATAGLSHISNVPLEDIERLAQQEYLKGTSTDPRSDMLLTLIQFNVFRACAHNSRFLAFNLDWLEYVAYSAFNKPDGTFNEAAPPPLQPTALQRSVPHHPWVDLLPFSALRDNLLRVYDVWPGEDDLCEAIMGFCSSPGARSGLIVWGEPWDPRGWEVTEGFAKQFGWLLAGCEDLMQATNAWRAVRHEPPLIIEELND